MYLARMPGESWRDALARVADTLGFAWEALRAYAAYVAKGMSDRGAAMMALHDYRTQSLAIV